MALHILRVQLPDNKLFSVVRLFSAPRKPNHTYPQVYPKPTCLLTAHQGECEAQRTSPESNISFWSSMVHGDTETSPLWFMVDNKELDFVCTNPEDKKD